MCAQQLSAKDVQIWDGFPLCYFRSVIISTVVELRMHILSSGRWCCVCSGPQSTLQSQLSQDQMHDLCEEMSKGGRQCSRWGYAGYYVRALVTAHRQASSGPQPNKETYAVGRRDFCIVCCRNVTVWYTQGPGLGSCCEPFRFQRFAILSHKWIT